MRHLSHARISSDRAPRRASRGAGGRLLILTLALAGGCTRPEARIPPAADASSARSQQAGCPSVTRHEEPGSAKSPLVRSPCGPSPLVEETLTLARSVEGRPILLHVLGTGTEHVLIFAGFHGNEPTGCELAESLLACLRSEPALCDGRQVAIAPVINPDGLARRTRTNANQVDINRNFAASNWSPSRTRPANRGRAPGSEPETQAVMVAVQLIEPARILSIHSIERGRQCNNYDGPAAALAQAMSARNGYPARATIGYETPGSFGTWAGVDRKIPTVTLELPRDASAAECWKANREALLTFIAGG